ncbi:hypothetical protein HPB47_012942 [Ixodes persulcatus]|uniref:Uncharacterized protein n=1 Tax=Ixodes persulcatus TaxID=34615 RepID=A0AC60NS38_IXOPE|nr:hypothetical protein HPB47_012942 [Ixodes persulcatus]
MAKGSVVQFASERQYDTSSRLRNRLFHDRYCSASDLYRKDLYAHFGCVNAIEFSADGNWLVSGGDDKRVLVWNVPEALSGLKTPRAMKGKHNSNIFCLCLDSCNRTVFSAGNDEQVILHDMETGRTTDVFLHQEAVYGLSVEPTNDSVFASACDDGCILIYDVREPSSTDPLLLVTSSSAFHAVAYNPVEPRLVATANSKEGVALWDVRRPRCCLLRYDSQLVPQGAMSVRFNGDGSLLLALRRRQPPALYRLDASHPVAQFDHWGYYNSCTMKSCCFAGERDEFILSGSDDFKLYSWKLPQEVTSGQRITSPRGVPSCTWVRQAHLVLTDHRSIVNQVRFNRASMVLASSGVEKIIKLWSSLPLPGGAGGLRCERPPEEQAEERRKRYTYEEYIDLVMESGQFMSHDYSHQSVREDPRMMAFFDSLVQRDEEGWSTDCSQDSASSVTVIPRASVTSSSSDELPEPEPRLVRIPTSQERRVQRLRQLRARLTSRGGQSSDSDDDWVPSPSPSASSAASVRVSERASHDAEDRAWHAAQREPSFEDARSAPKGDREEPTSNGVAGSSNGGEGEQQQASTSRFKRPRLGGLRSQRSYRRHNGSADT